MFQKTVNRNYATGFAGEFIKDGPRRIIPARIAPLTGAVAVRIANPNTVSRAFGYVSDMPREGTTLAALEKLVSVGGAAFAGILVHPKHYVLYGNSLDGALGSSMSLPDGMEGEFAYMGNDLMFELFNETTAVKAVNYGDGLAYALNTITNAQNPQALPFGALVSVAAGSNAPAGFALIPGARITNPVSLAASAAGAPVSAYTVGDLLQ